MNTPDELTTEQLMHRYLSPLSTIALQKFTAGVRVDEPFIRAMVQLTSDGYKPPIDTEGWQVVYDALMELAIERGYLPT